MCYLFVDICCNGRKRIYYNFLQEDIFGASFCLIKYIWFKKVIFQTNLKFWILDRAAKDAFYNFETNHPNAFLTRYDWMEMSNFVSTYFTRPLVHYTKLFNMYKCSWKCRNLFKEKEWMVLFPCYIPFKCTWLYCQLWFESSYFNSEVIFF